jgi:HSP20 family molecular chaperone IbpA
MKKIFDNKIIFAGLFFVLGFFSCWIGQSLWLRWHGSVATHQIQSKTPIAPGFPDSMFKDDEEGDALEDPFDEMRRMQKEMMQGLQNGKMPFEGGAGEVESREDDKFVYYDISIPGVDPNKLQVSIENGQLTVSGRSEQKSDDSSQGAYYSSQFHRTLPVPPNTDPDKVRVENSKDKITLMFPKISH